MSVDIQIPEVGESISEAILVEWLVDDGAVVEIDGPLFELETDKITLTVTAERRGRVTIAVGNDTTVTIGQVVGAIDEVADDEVAAAPAGAPAEAGEDDDLTDDLELDVAKQAEPPPQTEGPALHPPAGMAQVEAKLADGALDGLSPAVRRLVVEHGLDPAAIEGTGKGGRITKTDVQRHRKALADAPPPPTAPPPPPAPPAGDLVAAATGLGPQPAPAPVPAPVDAAARQTRTRMSTLRHRIAERLVEAQRTAAILTTFNEVDMSALFATRARYKEAFEKRHGVRLGFMSFFVKAAVDALRTVPEVNVFIDGDELVRNHYYDVGVAVSTDRGLVVPVIRDADQLSFAGVEARIGDLAKRAQSRKLELSELTGGVFTVSNGGVFGSLMSTPILNPPQSAILGMHGIKKRPVVVDDEIVIRPMMYLALSYDHRVIDGREAVTFLRRIVECVEDPERMLLEV